jgi:hypothetical protein
MLSSSKREADVEAAAALGADQYLVNPEPFNKWVTMIEILNHSRLRGDNGA